MYPLISICKKCPHYVIVKNSALSLWTSNCNLPKSYMILEKFRVFNSAIEQYNKPDFTPSLETGVWAYTVRHYDSVPENCPYVLEMVMEYDLNESST